MIDAKAAILASIDSALSPGDPRANPSAEWDKLSRSYIRTDSLAGEELLALFEHRLTDYGAHLHRCSESNIKETIGGILLERTAKKLLIAVGFPAEWIPSEIAAAVDENLSFARLDTFDGVLTTASAAIAATGSIVLQHGSGQGRRALTLIPDYHLCVVYSKQVVETVPAAFARLDPLKPTTFISGPSATADIEMTRIKGVHGPRFMDVVLVD